MPFAAGYFDQACGFRVECEALPQLSLWTENDNIKPPAEHVQKFPLADTMTMRLDISSDNSGIEKTIDRVTQFSVKIQVNPLARSGRGAIKKFCCHFCRYGL